MHMIDVRPTAPHLPSRSSELEVFAADVREGLSRPRKCLKCKYFYDDRGAALFEQICGLQEYYPTRSEMQIMQHGAGQMAAAIGPDAVIVELGSGSATKTRLLLDRLPRPAGYIPVDISEEQLLQVALTMANDYPGMEVIPLCADFAVDFRLPELTQPAGRLVAYFPGSTIGNFDPEPAKRFLARLRTVVGRRGGLLIGVDLKKDPAVLHAAYNDAAGITAEFNLNLLHRINRELEGRFVPDRFAHYAFYRPDLGRVEMHLVSRQRHTVTAAGAQFRFGAGESIFTESSYKYDPHEFVELVGQAGFELQRMWFDEHRWFSVQLFTAV